MYVRFIFFSISLSLILLLSLSFYLFVSSASTLISVSLFHCLRRHCFLSISSSTSPSSTPLSLFFSLAIFTSLTSPSSTLQLSLPPSPFFSSSQSYLSLTPSTLPSPSFSPPGTLLSEAVVTHLGTSLAQHSCVQTQPYSQSPTLQKEESREKGGVPDIIYPTPLITKHVKFSGKVRILCECVRVWVWVCVWVV